MFPAGPLNDHYIELLTNTAQLSKALPNGDSSGYTLEMMADVMMTAYETGSAGLNDEFIGTNEGLGWFEVDTPATTASREMAVRFGTKRGSTIKYSGDGTLVVGQRMVLFGRDNGTNVFGWTNGVALGSATGQADWTETQAADPLLIVSNFSIGLSSGGRNFFMRLYEMMLRINGRIIIHVRPKPYMADADTPVLVDLSEFGNDLTIAGTENTDWWIKRAWTEEPAFSGGENLG